MRFCVKHGNSLLINWPKVRILHGPPVTTGT